MGIGHKVKLKPNLIYNTTLALAYTFTVLPVVWRGIKAEIRIKSQDPNNYPKEASSICLVL